MLLLKLQWVFQAAGLGGRGEDGWVGWRWVCWLWNSRGFPSSGLCCPIRACPCYFWLQEQCRGLRPFVSMFRLEAGGLVPFIYQVSQLLWTSYSFGDDLGRESGSAAWYMDIELLHHPPGKSKCSWRFWHLYSSLLSYCAVWAQRWAVGRFVSCWFNAKTFIRSENCIVWAMVALLGGVISAHQCCLISDRDSCYGMLQSYAASAHLCPS